MKPLALVIAAGFLLAGCGVRPAVSRPATVDGITVHTVRWDHALPYVVASLYITWHNTSPSKREITAGARHESEARTRGP